MKHRLPLVFLCTLILFLFSGCLYPASEITLADKNMIETSDSWSPLDSFTTDGLPIHCEYEDKELVFEIHARDGSFYVQDESTTLFVSDIVVNNGGDAYWQYSSVPESEPPWNGTQTFLEILIKKGDSYIGYAVVKVERPENTWRYIATVLECKEVVQHGNHEYELSSETLRQMIDASIENNG